MVRARRGRGGGRGAVVPGLYAALLEWERQSFERSRVDPRWRYTEAGQRGEPALESWLRPRSARLDALEAGKPVALQGRDLRGVHLPKVPLRRDQAYDWFEIRPDDSVLSTNEN